MDQYKSAYVEADHVAALLRAALMRAGVPEAEVVRVRGLVRGSGRAYVELGAVCVGSAVKLCEALPLAQDSAAAVLPADAFG